MNNWQVGDLLLCIQKTELLQFSNLYVILKTENIQGRVGIRALNQEYYLGLFYRYRFIKIPNTALMKELYAN